MIIVTLFQFVEVKKDRLIVLIILLVASFVLEYSGISYLLFESSCWEVKYTLGRVLENLPYAIGGILAAEFWANRKTRYKWIIVLVFFVLSVFSYHYIPDALGFGNAGIHKFFVTMTICLFAINLPNKMTEKACVAVNWFASCTMGIFCMHAIVGRFLNMFMDGRLWQGTLVFDLIIFLICLIATVLFRLIAKKLLRWRWLDLCT